MRKFNRKSKSRPVASPKLFEFESETKNHEPENVIPTTTSSDMITEIVRSGARKILAEALEHEVNEFIEQYRNIRDSEGHRQVIRNGS